MRIHQDINRRGLWRAVDPSSGREVAHGHLELLTDPRRMPKGAMIPLVFVADWADAPFSIAEFHDDPQRSTPDLVESTADEPSDDDGGTRWMPARPA